MELCDPIVSVLVGLGLNTKDAYSLVDKLQSFSPRFRRRVLENAGFPSEIISTLLLLLEEIDKDKVKQPELGKEAMQSETIRKPLEEKAKEEKIVDLDSKGREKIILKTYKIREKNLDAASSQMPGYASLKGYFENREMVEKWLNSIENSFNQMPVKMQEKIMSRYIQLRTIICRDKKEISSSCMRCLIGNTIDCPLFNPPKQRGK
ncbi:MAG: hypothetical protein QXO71_08880 [Candidatus Jordarchaeaceae archaeon]